MKNKALRDLVALAMLSLLLTMVVLAFSTSIYRFPMFISYFVMPTVLLMNWLPIALVMGLFYAATGRGWVAFALTSLLVAPLMLVNYYKLLLRNDPLLFADLKLTTEAATMTGGGHYSLSVTPLVLGGVAVLALTTVFAAKKLRLRLTGRPMLRALCALGCGGALVAYTGVLCPAEATYAATGNYSIVSEWSPTGTYVCRGLIYPFFRSIKFAAENPPAGYDSQKAEAALAAYREDDIPAEKKVDVIGVMLESFGDFSKFPSLDFAVDPYADFHAIQAESYSGELVVNIFAGETINTERAFLTGYLDPVESFREPVNSFVWYFRRQGYACQGDHPCYNWFYNRLNINEYLGFEQYHFYEDRYKAYAEPGLIAGDQAFLPTIIEDYDAAKAMGKPVFSFNVTYQNHGPYFRDARYDQAYLPWKDGYSLADYNIANNYLTGVADTGKQLRAFVEHFRTEERPVVIVLFGDHKPWWGDGNSTYAMFGVNLDLGTEDGYYNYYTTPYLIWANDAAKKALNNQFAGDGGRTSPAFLMDKLFTLAGWDGPAYMKAIRALEAKTTFLNRQYRMENGVLTGVNADSSADPEWVTQFRQIEYYQKHSAVAAGQP